MAAAVQHFTLHMPGKEAVPCRPCPSAARRHRVRRAVPVRAARAVPFVQHDTLGTRWLSFICSEDDPELNSDGRRRQFLYACKYIVGKQKDAYMHAYGVYLATCFYPPIIYCTFSLFFQGYLHFFLHTSFAKKKSRV